MPCYRCGERQVDPDRGPSPWKRGVRGDSQVLICPGCQAGRDWAADLDRCGRCGTVRLVRRLGEVECRDCGQVGEPAGLGATRDSAAAVGERPAAAGLSEGALSEEVARALERVLGPSRAVR